MAKKAEIVPEIIDNVESLISKNECHERGTESICWLYTGTGR